MFGKIPPATISGYGLRRKSLSLRTIPALLTVKKQIASL